MDKFENRRRRLKLLIDTRYEGKAARFAAKIEREPSYVTRMLYPEGKPGKKRIAEDMVDLMTRAEGLHKDWFDWEGEGTFNSDMPPAETAAAWEAVDTKREQEEGVRWAHRTYPNAEPAAIRPHDAELVYVPKVSGASLSAGNGEVLWDFEQVEKSHAFRLDWMQKQGLQSGNCTVWTVRGDSMEQRYPHGSWVLINMKERTPIHGKNFALIGEDGLRLKQLRRTESGWLMYSLNADQVTYPPEPIVDDNYAIIGRVRGYGGSDD